ncbi:D-cysteine desulfhydrase family protein [Chondromyces apiculatus]|uniref:1-aminocyclopropane-1-carboxylate deaminase n=1 Tax=Chondromyces apiculatus DSM 436 TaxID=1192034 RepID=A0A017T6B4_9BACT|nr:D-cysteine desulfhydrase family protein [Chondromyces apiculatus]EYF04101.1 1-aminocyclopropane-1-carboxylate deaminase [Chondromyces apiculatus DSM 436]
MVRRINLAHLPTPLQRPTRLAEALGVDLYVKRDDMTGGAEAGNKIRKLEILLAAALAEGADTLITCGGIQSNHARATALLGASLGLRSILVLRTADPAAGAPLAGNVLLDRMAGAEIRLITPEQYRDRVALLASVAAEVRAAGGKPYVIPEGGSNGLGALGYVRAMEEVRRQLDLGLASGKPFDVIVHACGSGGTAAGLALGAAHYEVAEEVRTMVVCDDAPTFERIIAGIVDEARALEPALGSPATLRVDERARGPAYAVATPEQRRRIVEAARLGGLALDPVYTGKAFSGLWEMAERGELAGKRVLFLHTGGLPGLLVQADAFAGDLATA